MLCVLDLGWEPATNSVSWVMNIEVAQKAGNILTEKILASQSLHSMYLKGYMIGDLD
jgi:hypothetical protein